MKNILDIIYKDGDLGLSIVSRIYKVTSVKIHKEYVNVALYSNDYTSDLRITFVGRSIHAGRTVNNNFMINNKLLRDFLKDYNYDIILR